MAWSTDTEDVKMLLDIPSPMNVMNDQLALNLVDICLDNTIHILRKSLLCFAKILRILNFQLQNSMYLALFSMDFNKFDLKI